MYMYMFFDFLFFFLHSFATLHALILILKLAFLYLPYLPALFSILPISTFLALALPSLALLHPHLPLFLLIIPLRSSLSIPSSGPLAVLVVALFMEV